jgi:hypothetical protein
MSVGSSPAAPSSGGAGGTLASAAPGPPAGGDARTTPRARIDVRPGIVAAILVTAMYGGMGLSVQFPRVAFGFQSDESTYYLMTYSLARDGDLVYRREDLARVWRDFPSGPSGLFLKRGSQLGVRADGTWPFLHVAATPDADPTRLYYGKSPVYPAFAAPFVALAGTNGFVLFHAVLLGLMTWAAYAFLNLRASPMVALLLGSSFVLATVVPAYAVWMTPELFNLACVLLGYFFWLYKEVAVRETTPRGYRWLLSPNTDLLSAVLLGLATASKPTNLLLAGPPLLWLLSRRQWRHAVVTGIAFTAVVVAFFGATMAISGEWNFQGGDRRTFYGAFPFQTPTHSFDTLGADRATDRLLTEIVFDPSVFATVFLHNLWWFFAGRYSGLVAYFFPAVFALAAFAVARGRRTAWQYLVLAVGLIEIVLLLVTIPYNYFGGGGVLGNRYFMNAYGVFLFLLPPVESVGLALVPWLIGALFTAQITLNGFFSSFYPGEHAKHGPLRLLPVELSLINELPVNTDPRKARIWFGALPRFQIYFLDDNAYEREQNSFWVRGDSTADVLIKSAEPAGHLSVTLANGPLANRVTVRTGGERQTVELQPRETREISLALGDGFPYQGRWVWEASLVSQQGFVPMFEEGGGDNRFLGVFVKPELTP